MMLLGLARWAARKSRKHHYFTLRRGDVCVVDGEVELPAEMVGDARLDCLARRLVRGQLGQVDRFVHVIDHCKQQRQLR